MLNVLLSRYERQLAVSCTKVCSYLSSGLLTKVLFFPKLNNPALNTSVNRCLKGSSVTTKFATREDHLCIEPIDPALSCGCITDGVNHGQCSYSSLYNWLCGLQFIRARIFGLPAIYL